MYRLVEHNAIKILKYLTTILTKLEFKRMAMTPNENGKNSIELCDISNNTLAMSIIGEYTGYIVANR